MYLSLVEYELSRFYFSTQHNWSLGPMENNSRMFLNCFSFFFLYFKGDVGSTTSPGVETTSPGVETTSPGVETTSFGVETTSFGVETTSPGVETTSPGVETTSRGVATTTFGDVSTSPLQLRSEWPSPWGSTNWVVALGCSIYLPISYSPQEEEKGFYILLTLDSQATGIQSVSHVCVNSLHAGYIFITFAVVCGFFFSKLNFQKNLLGTLSECQTHSVDLDRSPNCLQRFSVAVSSDRVNVCFFS